MPRWINIFGAVAGGIAMLCLFLLPMVNPPVSTGAQWLSLQALIPVLSYPLIQPLVSSEYQIRQGPQRDRSEVFTLDTVRRC